MSDRICRRAVCVVLVLSLVTSGVAVLAGEADEGRLPEPRWNSPSEGEIAEAIDGLAFDAFVETSYRLYLMRFPQTLTALGLAEVFGVRNDRLNDYSEAYVRETERIESMILERLRGQDRDALSDEQRLTYDVCTWYWDDRVRGHAYVDFDHPVTHFFITSLDLLLYDTMTETHPIRSVDEAWDYVIRLHQVADQFAQVLDTIDRRRAQGIIVPRVMIDWALPDIQAMAYASAERHPSVSYTHLRAHET